VDEAMAESERIFGSELEEASAFKNELKSSLEKAPLHPKQLSIPFVDAYGEEIYVNEPPKNPRTPLPKSPAPDPESYRVEIRRESRKSEKDVRVVSL
ncbi:TPA: hypothetical protein ACP2SZ_005118, partial [Escherichia coli]